MALLWAQGSDDYGRPLLGGVAGSRFAEREAGKGAGAQFFAGWSVQAAQFAIQLPGHGVEGLKLLREVADETGLLVITEVMEISQIEVMLPYIDCFQVGARNMQNFNLLRELGHVRKPVLMKRGIAATIEEVLLSAEYILSGGNYDLMLCERGIRTYETYTRNTMDISAIPVLKKLTHLRCSAILRMALGFATWCHRWRWRVWLRVRMGC